jgi:hypothetical protein
VTASWSTHSAPALRRLIWSEGQDAIRRLRAAPAFMMATLPFVLRRTQRSQLKRVMSAEIVIRPPLGRDRVVLRCPIRAVVPLRLRSREAWSRVKEAINPIDVSSVSGDAAFQSTHDRPGGRDAIAAMDDGGNYGGVASGQRCGRCANADNRTT